MQNKKYINNIGILLKLCKRLDDNDWEGDALLTLETCVSVPQLAML